jgi:hypothetical protein
VKLFRVVLGCDAILRENLIDVSKENTASSFRVEE